MSSDKWPPMIVAALKRYWDGGLGDGEIAARLSADFGVPFTKSAVIGRRHRMGLWRADRQPERLVKKISAHGTRQRESKKKIVLVPPNAPPGAVIMHIRTVVTVPMPSDMLERSRCCWPVTDEAPFLFCGLPKADGDKVYCSRHRAISSSPRKGKTYGADSARLGSGAR